MPEGGKELVGYKVEYWVKYSKGCFLTKGIIVRYRKIGKYGRGSYSGGVYYIKCSNGRTYSKRRSEFNLISK